MEKYIYVVMSHTSSAFATLIKYCSRAEYSHVSLALDEQLDEIYSFGRLRPRNPFIGGFVEEDIQKGTFARFKNTYAGVYKVPVEKEQYNQLLELIGEFKKDPRKYGYNLVGVVALRFGITCERENKYFCSHFVAEVLEESGILEFDKAPNNVTPIDFNQKMNQQQLIYMGKLAHYPERINELSYT